MRNEDEMGPAPGGEVETLLPCDEDVPELWGNSWGVTNSDLDLGLE